ncbi:hydroxyisourate hydrolase [Pseudonocardia kongjuensis]|uniref:5-hydroxyisourate hydrolase n=1 Tax=Pseudonocardia kongjuensis TaxID=102227 RepID=A0ABN1XMA9_9PSEU
MSSFSTHVLDTARGAPAAGVPVGLQVRSGTGWSPLASGRTDDDGRWRAPDDAALVAGTDHRVVFDLAGYGGFFPEAAIVFRPATTDRHHHVPLLLSPYSYSTYLGS